MYLDWCGALERFADASLFLTAVQAMHEQMIFRLIYLPYRLSQFLLWMRGCVMDSAYAGVVSNASQLLFSEPLLQLTVDNQHSPHDQV